MERSHVLDKIIIINPLAFHFQVNIISGFNAYNGGIWSSDNQRYNLSITLLYKDFIY